MIDKIGIQTFTIRKLIQTPDKMKEKFLELNKFGIKNFELARISFSEDEMKMLKTLKDTHGIRYSVCQIKLKDIEKKIDWYINFAKTLDIEYLEVSVIPIKSFLQKKKGLLQLSKRLNTLGEKLLNEGIKLLYHHHHYELVNFDEKLGLELLMNHTDSNYLNFVVDTYWLTRGGFDPTHFIDKHHDRIKGVHLRDYDLKFKRGRFSITDATLGQGRINFKSLVKNDAEWTIDFYSIEQATDTPMVDLKRSYEYIKNLIDTK